MKLAIINFSGNVGKSTIAKHLLMPRMQDAELIAVESINADDHNAEMIRGKQFGQLQEQLMMLDSAIVDIGASNVEDFLKLMQNYHGSHEDFDYYIIPVVKESKQIKDTIATIQALSAMGVPPQKIRVIFNKLDIDETFEEVFYPLIAFHEDTSSFYFCRDAVIFYNELYQKLQSFKLSIEALLNDKTDYKSAIKSSYDIKEKARAVNMVSMQRLAITAKRNLDTVFGAVIN